MTESTILNPIYAGRPIALLTSDSAWLDAMLEAEIGLAAAQAQLGIIPTSARIDIETGARTHHFDLDRIAIAAQGAANPVVAFVDELTTAVAAIDTDSANYVHRGCTSQDILDTAAMLVASRALQLIVEDLTDTARSLAQLARAHRTTPAPARTLAMHAVPTTFGAKCATWLSGVLHARTRCIRVRESLPVQLGGAAGTLASYLEAADQSPATEANHDTLWVHLTNHYADALDLRPAPMPWHTTRTPLADIAAALNVTAGALGKIAVDVISLARTEVAEVREPAAAGRGASSTMPQKRNPAMSALIRGAAAQIPSHTAVLFTSMVAEDERPAGAWHAEWDSLRCALRLAGGATATAAELTAGIETDPDQMARNLDMTGGQIVTERLSAALATHLGKKTTKELLTRAAFAAQRNRTSLDDEILATPELRDALSDGQLRELLDPTHYLGAAPFIVDRALELFANSSASHQLATSTSTAAPVAARA